VLPGLFDTHTHVMFSSLDWVEELMTPFSFMYYDAIRNLGATLSTGITTVRDASGADAGVRKAVDDGVIPGPRMQISITMLSQTGGHNDGWVPSGVDLNLEWPGSTRGIVDGPEEVRRKVRELIRAGADVIKVATSGGVLSPTDDPRHPHFRPDELDGIVAEASAAGLFVMAHAQGAEGIKNAIRADRASFTFDFLKNFYNYDVTGGTLVSDRVLEDNWNVAAGASPTGTLQCVDSWLEDFRNDVSRNTVPTLIIHGDADRILPAAATARRQAKMIKHVTFAEIAGGPHGLCWTHADRVNAALLPFVA